MNLKRWRAVTSLFHFSSSLRSNHALFWNTKIILFPNWRTGILTTKVFRLPQRTAGIDHELLFQSKTVFEFYHASCGIMWRLNYQIYVWFCISIYWRIEPTVSQGLSFCHYYYNFNTFRYFWFISWWSVC